MVSVGKEKSLVEFRSLLLVTRRNAERRVVDVTGKLGQ